MKALASLVGLLALTGCASIDAVPLDPNAEGAIDGAARGFRVPRMVPYLLVAALPAVPKASNDAPAPEDVAPPVHRKKPIVIPGAPAAGTPHGAGVHGPAARGPIAHAPVPHGPVVHAPAVAHVAAVVHAPGAPGAAAPDKKGDANGKGDSGSDADTSGTMAAGSGSDTSFSVGNTIYAMKIVYLPDYRHATAVRVKSGLFGVGSLQMSFQNGMMTSLSTKVDNTKMGDVVTAAVQALVKAATGGAAAAAPAAPGGKPKGTKNITPANNVLAPGLYAFVPSTHGTLHLCKVNSFTSDGAPIDSDCDVTPVVATGLNGQ